MTGLLSGCDANGSSGAGSLTWLDLGRDVVAFVNSDITVVVNLGSSTLTLPGAVTGSRLAPDTAVWLAS